MNIVFRLMAYLAIVLPACAAEAAATGWPDWADKRLPKIPGIVLWLDAYAQPVAARAHGSEPGKNGDSLTCEVQRPVTKRPPRL